MEVSCCEDYHLSCYYYFCLLFNQLLDLVSRVTSHVFTKLFQLISKIDVKMSGFNLVKQTYKINT